VYDFQNCDFDGIAQALLLHPLNFSTPHGTADDAWMHFIQPVYDVIDKFVPVKAKRPINKKVSSKKYPKHIIRAVRKKAALWRRYSRSKTSSNKAAYCEQVEVRKSLVFEYERTKELNVIQKSNLGALYRFVNKRLAAKSGVGPLR